MLQYNAYHDLGPHLCLQSTATQIIPFGLQNNSVRLREAEIYFAVL
jgi:hypothetical protein